MWAEACHERRDHSSGQQTWTWRVCDGTDCAMRLHLSFSELPELQNLPERLSNMTDVPLGCTALSILLLGCPL